MKKSYSIYCVYIKPVFFAAIIICCGCNNDPNKKQEQKENKQPAIVRQKPAAGNNDTFYVTKPAAIFFVPGSRQLQQIKNGTDTMTFASMQHDCFYQQRNARNVLQKNWPRVWLPEAVTARYILFRNNKTTIACIDLDQNNDACGLYLFNGSDTPKPADMTNIETEAGFYFRKKG